MDSVFNYGTDLSATESLRALKPIAANLSYGAGPAYSLDDFYADFPQFAAIVGPALSEGLLTKFITMATASLSYDRYGPQWSYCVGLYAAHFATLHLAATQGAANVAGFLGASVPKLVATSMSALGASVSYDSAPLSNDLKGWAVWKTTTYGAQFATFAKIAGLGGMLVT